MTDSHNLVYSQYAKDCGYLERLYRPKPFVQSSRSVSIDNSITCSCAAARTLTIIYPVKDMAPAKMQFRTLLGVEPYPDAPYYVGFKVGNQDIGLVPNSPGARITAFYHIDDIKQSLQSLLDAGSQILREIKDVGGRRLIASVRDADGNIIGLIQDA